MKIEFQFAVLRPSRVISTVELSFYDVGYSPVAMNQIRAMVSLLRQVHGPYNAFSCNNDRSKRLCRLRAKG